MQHHELAALIHAGQGLMDERMLRFWHLISIPPAKWALHPWADEDGGFWAVALLGHTVVWYNAVEEGFNVSHYSEIGTIAEYWCDQKQLQHVVSSLLRQIDTGITALRAGPPTPIAL